MVDMGLEKKKSQNMIFIEWLNHAAATSFIH